MFYPGQIEQKGWFRVIDPIGQRCRMWTHIRLTGRLIVEIRQQCSNTTYNSNEGDKNGKHRGENPPKVR